MKLVNRLIFTSLAVMVVHTASAELVAQTVVVKAGFVKEHALSHAQKLLGGDEAHYYVANQDGSIDQLDYDGNKVLTLQQKHTEGSYILKKAEAVAVANKLIYVVDSENSQVAIFDAEGRYQASFGTRQGGFFGGKAGVELNSPRGLAVYEGTVHVADTGNGKIQIYGINGVFLATLDIDGSPENRLAHEKKLPYKLSEPTDIAISAEGLIYVLDAKDGLIKIYHPDGKFLRHLSHDGKLLTFSMAAEGIYVVDKDTLIVRRYGYDDKSDYAFGSRGVGTGLFKSITGLAAGKDRKIFVGDSKSGLVNVFQAEDGIVFQSLPKMSSRVSVQVLGSVPATVTALAWDGRDTLYAVDAEKKSIIRIRNGKMEGEIINKDITPVALAVDRFSTLWVVDKESRKIIKMDDTGAILSSIGSKGSKKGQLDSPSGIAIANNGDIYIADPGNNWVQVFNNEGGFVKTISKSTVAALDEPAAIALDSVGNLYVLDKGRAVVSVFNGKGEPVLEFGKSQDLNARLQKPVALMVSADEIYVVDTNQVKVYSSQGQYRRSFAAKGSAAGELDEPLAIAAGDSTTFFIAERNNKRIQTWLTLYKPATPENLLAQSGVHSVDLKWTASALPYIKQYQIYRSKKVDSGFVKIGISQSNQYIDKELSGDEKNYYRVRGETYHGYAGASSAAEIGVALKFIPPVLESVQTESGPWQIKMTWKPVEKQLLNAYLIYQKEGEAYVKVGETTVAEYVKSSLRPDSKYTFYISTLSTDNIESEKFQVNAATTPFNKAPLEIEVLKLRDIFSNTYKLYEDEGVGRIKLTNNTDKAMENIKVSFVLKNIMDYPTESRIELLQPGKSVDIPLLAVFNNGILNISEDSSVQALIEASYYENGAQVVFGKNSTAKVYDKHRLTWDERGRYAAFVTPKDPPLMNFVRAVATQFHETKDEAQLAAIVFQALGVAGLTYLPDPTNPYQIASGKTDTVDYVQYPRDTLSRKSGDCDDLVAIYSAALENLGIYTLVLEAPGHMFMMFSTGMDAESDGYTNNDLYVIHNGKLWIPVETTIVGSPFVKAWELGASNYYKWKNKGLTVLDVHEAWATFKPATLPDTNQPAMDVSAKQMEKKFSGDLNSVLKISSQTRIRNYLQLLQKNPADIEARLQAGIALAKLGDRSEAMKYFDKIISAEPKNAAALNNRGNLYLIEGDFSRAQKNYQAATLSSPEDAAIWVNLAKSYKAMKNKKQAKEAFARAQKLDETMKNQYKALALELLHAM